MIDYTGFDPLKRTINEDHHTSIILDNAKRREVNNILKCYTGNYDLFAEMIQNSLDATEKRFNSNKNYKPIIKIMINEKEHSFSVADNGIGMNRNEFEFCLAPNISFKEEDGLRGNKGVGATFLAYAYDWLQVYTKQDDFEANVKLENGNKWISDKNNKISRPVFENFNKHNHEWDQGACFKVIIDNNAKRRRVLTSHGANNPDTWFSLLRIKSPLGMIQLQGEKKEYNPQIIISYTDRYENTSIKTYDHFEYLYPHEIPELRFQNVDDIDKEIEKLPGDYEEKYEKLNKEYKKLNAVYGIWDKELILENSKKQLSKNLDEEQKGLIEDYNISIYGFFCNTVKLFDIFNDDYLKLKKDLRIMRGGLQLATDGMPQGDLITIPLTKMIGYQNQSHIIIHFENGNPDLGRKVFQPELNTLAEELSKNVVNYLRKYRNHLKADETSTPLAPSKIKHQWIRDQENFQEKHPFTFFKDKLSILSTPQKEQDVVVLFGQMLGSGLLKGYEIFATSEHQQYDSIIQLEYDKYEKFVYSSENRIGISDNVIDEFPFESEPKILEYKYDFDALIREFNSGDKFHNHIDLVWLGMFL